MSAGRTAGAAAGEAGEGSAVRAIVLLLGMLTSGSLAAEPAHEPHVLLAGHIDLAIGPDGNTVILDAPEGLVVIDTGRHASHAEAILRHAGAVGKPVVAVVNTHWHLDHTTGNADLLAAFPQARLVATDAIEGALAGYLADAPARARARAEDDTLPEDERARARRALEVLQNRAVLVARQPVTEDGPVELGGRGFELRAARAAATEADLWLLAPDERLAVVGDLVVAPVPFFDTGCERGWRDALDAIEAASWSTLIPGHGAPMSRAGFARWRRAFDAWLDCAASESAAAQCADGWMRDAAGFYGPEEAASVRTLAEAYVARVLRAPVSERMTYCAENAVQETP